MMNARERHPDSAKAEEGTLHGVAFPAPYKDASSITLLLQGWCFGYQFGSVILIPPKRKKELYGFSAHINNSKLITESGRA